jgi:hypothetical protein
VEIPPRRAHDDDLLDHMPCVLRPQVARLPSIISLLVPDMASTLLILSRENGPGSGARAGWASAFGKYPAPALLAHCFLPSVALTLSETSVMAVPSII